MQYILGKTFASELSVPSDGSLTLLFLEKDVLYVRPLIVFLMDDIYLPGLTALTFVATSMRSRFRNSQPPLTAS